MPYIYSTSNELSIYVDYNFCKFYRKNKQYLIVLICSYLITDNAEYFCMLIELSLIGNIVTLKIYQKIQYIK